MRRHAELVEQASALQEGSVERKALEKLISELEEYRLPKPTPIEQQAEPIQDHWGQIIAWRSSLRRRYKPARAGHPAEYRIQSRAALEDMLADPTLTWTQLAKKYHFKDVEVLKRAVRRLKGLLKRAGISLPTQDAIQEARQALDEAREAFFRARGEE